MNHINAPSMGQPSTVLQDETRAPQNGTGAPPYPSQYPSGGTPNAAPAGAAAPAWLQQAAERNPHLPPEVAHAQAEAERVKGLADFARESNKVEETKLKQEEVKLKRDMLKKGLGHRRQRERSSRTCRAHARHRANACHRLAMDWMDSEGVRHAYCRRDRRGEIDSASRRYREGHHRNAVAGRV